MDRIQPMDDRNLVRVLKALADPKRFQMLREIATAGELSCGQIGERFDLSQPTISHHLKILNDANLLVVREKGQHHFISVNRTLVNSVLELLPNRLAPFLSRKVKRTRAKAR